MRFENLTPHTIDIYSLSDVTGEGFKRTLNVGAEPILTVEPSGTVLRVQTRTQPGEVVDVNGVSVSINKIVVGVIDELPPAIDGVIYIVAMPCADQIAAAGRKDFVIIADQIRNDRGAVCGALGFSRIVR